MEQDRISALIDRYITGQLTKDECGELDHLLSIPENNAIENELLARMEKEAQAPVEVDEGQVLSLFRNIISADRTGAEGTAVTIARIPPQIPVWRTWWAAASVIILLGAGIFFWMHSKSRVAPTATSPKVKDIAPGREGAVLTLADGSKVLLDSMHTGVISQQSGAAVVLKSGQLAYDATDRVPGEVAYNTLSTPKGRQFQLLLPDGTRVWLNSASSLRFPTVFAGKERRVEVWGEAYFEVAKNAHKPFLVTINTKAEVKVLGTHFNINAYDNEDKIKTTLLEGSVKITASQPLSALSATMAVLKPGQQAQLTQGKEDGLENGKSAKREITVVNDVDVDKVMAWKNGLFNFEGMHLREVMKQLERWYDIDVAFEGDVPDIEFYGELSRNNTLNDVIEALKDVDVHFRVDGRRLIVFK
jgi:ferric-dicitrate binding protein FerR (iron transport regulator)